MNITHYMRKFNRFGDIELAKLSCNVIREISKSHRSTVHQFLQFLYNFLQLL